MSISPFASAPAVPGCSVGKNAPELPQKYPVLLLPLLSPWHSRFDGMYSKSWHRASLGFQA